MAPEDIRLVRRTWARVVLERQVFGFLFYERLFALAPDTRPLFPSSLDVQGEKLFLTVNWIVDNLDDAGTVLREAQELAIRHLGYGVEARDYEPVGQALIAAMERGLSGGLSPPEVAAWTRVYGGLSAEMIAAAYSEPGWSDADRHDGIGQKGHGR